MPELKPQLVRIQGTERYQRLLAGVPSTAAMKSGAMTLQPGESVGEHKTEGKEEAILILEGKAEVYVAGELVFTAEQDSLVYIPPETNHDPAIPRNILSSMPTSLLQSVS